MGAHLINWQGPVRAVFERGFVGVGIHENDRMRADMLADLKRVREGELVFIHAEERIWGIFRATAGFLCDPNEAVYPHHLPLATVVRFPQGAETIDLWRLRDAGKLWTVPFRFKYDDAARTVRPLTDGEAEEIARVLMRRNPRGPEPALSPPEDTTGFEAIPIPLETNGGQLRFEKELEAWILDSRDQDQLKRVYGKPIFWGNKIPTSYFKTIDLLCLQEGNLPGVFEEKCRFGFIISELKAGRVDEDALKQMLGYIEWVSHRWVAGQKDFITGVLIGSEIHRDVLQYVQQRNRLEQYGNPLKLLRYRVVEGPPKTLSIEQVEPAQP